MARLILGWFLLFFGGFLAVVVTWLIIFAVEVLFNPSIYYEATIPYFMGAFLVGQVGGVFAYRRLRKAKAPTRESS